MSAKNSGTSFAVLFVCTGNICRSPLGERLLSQQLEGLHVQSTISSAGTRAMLGGDVPSEILKIGASLNSPLEKHSPRQLTADMINESDLILTAERVHRSEVVSLVPRASGKTFTFKQFARLAQEHEEFIAKGELGSPSISSLRDLVSEIADFRSLASPINIPSEDDVEDPYMQSQQLYSAAGEEIQSATESISAVIRKYL